MGARVGAPDLQRRFAPAASTEIREEIGNALGRLLLEKPKLAHACEPATVGKLVSLVLYAIDQECRWRFGLWTLEERRRYLRVWSVLRADGVDIGMDSRLRGAAGARGERGGREGSRLMFNFVALRTKRKEELLQIPAIMEMVERIVSHAYAVVRERGYHLTDLNPGGFRAKGAGYARISFFTD